MLKPKEPRKEYYVYAHVAADGVVEYIGKGCGNRCYSLARGKLHKHWIKSQYPRQYVEIIQDNLTEQEAFALERKMLLSGEYSPKFNELLRQRI
jgi:excinuclease UvrABC nuclease subunit